MRSLLETLMWRDDLDEDEALAWIRESQEQFMDALEDDDFLGAMDWMEDEFGLEPDYLEDFLF